MKFDEPLHVIPKDGPRCRIHDCKHSTSCQMYKERDSTKPTNAVSSINAPETQKGEGEEMSLNEKLNELLYRHTAKTLALGYLRYEALRRLNATQFSRLCQRNINGERFDDLVDELINTKELE